MSSRDYILNKLRSVKFPDINYPDIPSYNIPGNPLENFQSKLEGFSGKYLEFDSRESALLWLKDHVDFAEKVFSCIPEIKGNVKESDVENRHNCAEISVTMVESDLGVGETGSVWLTDKSLHTPASALLCRDLYVLLRKENIVSGIHDAYERIDLGSRAYGSFYSGPSATADIEAVHITGAQGEISLTALLY